MKKAIKLFTIGFTHKSGGDVFFDAYPLRGQARH